MEKKEKKELVIELKNSFKDLQTLIITDYKGLKVSEMTDLRTKLSKKQASFRVIKNSLAKLTFKDGSFNELLPYLKETTGVAYTSNDAVACAKTLVDFHKEHENLKFKAGWLNGKVLDSKAIEALAKLPNREVLLSMLVGNLQGPISGFVRVLAGSLIQLVRVLDGINKKKAVN